LPISPASDRGVKVTETGEQPDIEGQPIEAESPLTGRRELSLVA
jgi:hypothetical protein